MDKGPASSLGFGCVKLSTHSHQRAALATLKAAYDVGIRWFDTAPLYGQGYSEAILGQFIRTLSSQDRAELKVVSKFGLGPAHKRMFSPTLALPLNRMMKFVKSRSTKPIKEKLESQLQEITPATKSFRGISADQIKAQLHATLRRLGIEQLHGYLAHEALPHFIEPDGKEFLLEMRAKERLVSIGVGVDAANLLADSQGDYSWIDIIQYQGWDQRAAERLIRAFPNQQHVHHSLMKFRSTRRADSDAGLSNQINKFPQAILLFSSSNPRHIKANAREFG